MRRGRKKEKSEKDKKQRNKEGERRGGMRERIHKKWEYWKREGEE